MPDQVEIEIKAAFPHTHLKRGKFTYLIPLDPEIEGLIGKVVIYWGAFELRMDTLIFEIAKGMQRSLDRDWETQGFRRRKEIFKKLLTRYAKEMFPDWQDRLAQLVDTAGDLHWRRNIFAHGHYEIDVIPGSPPSYRMKASGIVKGKRRFLIADEPTLAKLWHDISHLLGDLMTFINHTGAKSSSVELVTPDEDFLRGDIGEARLLAVSEKLPPASPSPQK